MRVMMVDPLFTTLPYDKCLCAALARSGHQVCMVGRPLRDGEVWDVPSVQHVQLNTVDLFKPSSLSGLALRGLSAWRHLQYSLEIQLVARLAVNWRADVVHFQWCLTPPAELLLLRRLRRSSTLVFTIHDTVPFNGSKVSSLMTLGLGSLQRQFDRLIVHTATAKKELMAQGIAQRTIFTVPHGPLGARRSSNPERQPPLAQEHHEKLRFLLFGIMKNYKGIDVLIEAASLLPRPARDKCKFIVAGKPAMELAGLIRRCRDAGVEELFEFDARHIPDEEVEGLLESADVFLFPYRKIEASGVFTIALQYGRPFIASNIGIFKEQIVHGQHGLLVEPESSLDLANAVRFIVDRPDERLKMGRNVEKQTGDLPSWDQIAATTEEVYDGDIRT